MEGVARARQDLLTLFPQAIQSGQQGFQGAIDVFRDVVPQQSQIFQQGNINAQNTLLAGLPQQQNAILGGNVNLGALQPTNQFQPDFGFLNQQIGQQSGQQAVTPQNAQPGQNIFGLASGDTPARFSNVTPQGSPSRERIMLNFLNAGGNNLAVSNALAGKI